MSEAPPEPARRQPPWSAAALAAAAAIARRWSKQPAAGLILGTGLGRFASRIVTEALIDYREIPHFPRSTALAHRGQLVCGQLRGTPVVALEGRCHYYEGYPLAQLMLPVFTLAALGVQRLVLTNASGGLNPHFASGDIMVLDSHINLMFWPARGLPDAVVSSARGAACYDAALGDQALAVARRENFAAHRGVYVAMSGPNYETRAEYRALRKIGGDVVGMSTVPEAVAASCCGLRTVALSVVTNLARPDRPHVTQAEDVVDVAAGAEPKLRRIILDVVSAPWPSGD